MNWFYWQYVAWPSYLLTPPPIWLFLTIAPALLATMIYDYSGYKEEPYDIVERILISMFFPILVADMLMMILAWVAWLNNLF